MFTPLPKDSSSNVVPLPAPPEWRPILPVPEAAPQAPATHYKHGAPSSAWTYRSATGHLLFHVCRFDHAGGGKDVLPLTFCENGSRRAWRWKGPPAPRPLYGLDRLAACPEAPVIVTEGEKAADAAGGLLPGYVAVTSPGGSLAAKKADWAALAGRRVVIWRDADEAGATYEAAVVAMLAKLSPLPAIAAVVPAAGAAEGWDAADALAEGWTPARAQALVAAAAPVEKSPDGETKQKKPTQRDGLIDLLDAIELWHDPGGNAYATVPESGHRENLEITGRAFRGWLTFRCYEANGYAPGAQVIDDVVRVAATIAVKRGPEHPTWRRVGQHDGRVYLDLGDESWRAVEITADGWHIIAEPPVKFLRSRGMRALPEPEAGELIEELRELVNLGSEEDFKLLVAWLTMALWPRGPYPILVVTGEQGAAKSTLAKLCRLLIDPAMPASRSPSKDERDLFIAAGNCWVLSFDNLSGVSAWFSDALCRLASDGGFATRALHTDDDEVLFTARRPMILNGIAELASRGDLAERAIVLSLPRMQDDRRLPEEEF